MKKLLTTLLTLLTVPLLSSAQDNITARRPFGQHTVSFSATPTFDASISDSFKMTLTGNVTSSTLIGMESGVTLKFEICQDGTGSRTFAWPSQMVGPIAILSSPNVCTVEFFHYDGTSATNPTTATSGGGGSGTVNAGTTGQVAYYGANGTTISGNTKLDEGNTTANTLTYTGTGGVSAATFNATGSGSMSLIGTEGTPSGAASGKDVLALGDSVSHTAQISNNGDSFRTIATHDSTSPVLGGIMVSGPSFPRMQASPRGVTGQPFLEVNPGVPGFGQLDLSLSNNVLNRLVKANQTASTVYNDQVNTFTAAGTLDASASTVTSAVRVPVVAGLTTALNGGIGYDSTNNMFHGGLNSADSRFVSTTITPTDTFCAQWTRTSGHYELGQASGTCGTPGGAGALSGITAAVGANSINNGDNAQTWNASLTTAGKHWFTVTENSASVATGTPYLFDIHSIASSTANPIIITALGTANGWNLLNSANPLWAPVGTGAIAIPGSAKGVVVSQGGAAAATTVTGTNNQLLSFDGSGNPIAADPIVSYNYVNLWTAQDVTVTRTSAVVRVSTFSQYGTLLLTWASITGSPATCTLQIKSADSAGNLQNNGSTINVSPANGSSSVTFTPAAALGTASQMQAVFACGTYPTTGTLTLDFAPAITTYVPNTVANNLTQLAGTAVDVNSGNKSAGTQRVVIATDQPNLTSALNVALAANQSVNVAQVAGTTTDTNSGTKSAGTIRVVLATDQPQLTNKLLVTPDANVKVNVVGNAGANLDAATGAAVPANGIYLGGNGSGNLTGIISCDNSTAVNMSTATTTQIIAISGTGGRTYICSINLVTAAANNVALVSGSGTNCASNLAGLAGGTTAASGWNFAANGGLTLGNGLGMVIKTVTTNNEVCLVTSAATQLSGTITWTQF